MFDSFFRSKRRLVTACNETDAEWLKRQHSSEEEHFIKEIQILRPQPGDTVVLTVRRTISAQDMARLKEVIHLSLDPVLPQGVRWIILEDMDMAVLRSTDDL